MSCTSASLPGPSRGKVLRPARSLSMLSNCRTFGTEMPASRLHARSIGRYSGSSAGVECADASTRCRSHLPGIIVHLRIAIMGSILEKPGRFLITILVGALTAGLALAQQATVVGTLDGHTDPVYAIAWSPDGKTLATAGFDNTVRLWDAATRKEIKKYDGHTKLVLAVAISPDGKHFSQAAWTTPPRSGTCPTSGPAKTFARSLRRARWHSRSSPTASSSRRRRARSIKVWDLAPGPWSRNWPDTPATCRASPGAAMAARSPRATRPTRSGSGKATSTPDGADRNSRDGRARAGLPAQQPATRLGGLRRAGAALAASRRRAAAIRRQGAGRGLRP